MFNLLYYLVNKIQYQLILVIQTIFSSQGTHSGVKAMCLFRHNFLTFIINGDQIKSKGVAIILNSALQTSLYWIPISSISSSSSS